MTSKYDNGRQAQALRERILANIVVTETGCWEWQGQRRQGYGRMKIGSRRDGTRRSVTVHVMAYEEWVGQVPDGLTLDHDPCNNPPCVNPAHLVPRTMKDNTLRSETSPTAVNARKTACPKCGGPFTIRNVKNYGTNRYCRPCYLKYLRKYNAKRSGKKTSANSPA